MDYIEERWWFIALAVFCCWALGMVTLEAIWEHQDKHRAPPTVLEESATQAVLVSP